MASILAVLALAAACKGEPALLRQRKEERLVDAIRGALLESVEAEKSAVLATTDEESRELAGEAERYTRKIDGLRGELRGLVLAGGRAGEIERLDAFDAAWSELKGVDQRLLALAVANTNLKAERLSVRDGAEALDGFVVALSAAEATSGDPAVLRILSAAVVAGLREQSLLLVHIQTAAPDAMTRLEEQMHELAADVARNLADARAAGVAPEQIAIATKAWDEHQRIAAEVVRLSRENSNVLSFDVSVHEKRKVTRECLAALDALREAIESSPQAAR